MSRYSKIIIHVLFWVFSSILTLFMWGGGTEVETGGWYGLTVNYSLQVLSRMFCFYLNYFWLVPVFLAKKRYGYYVLFTLLSAFLHLTACANLWVDFTRNHSVFERTLLGAMSWSFLFNVMVSTGLKMLDIWDKSEKKKQQLEKELRETELLFLQSQMSPHFLFNTLNNIYGLSLNNSVRTAASVHQLKDLMHYFLYMENGDKVLLDKELENLGGYIDLQKLRNTVEVIFNKQMSDEAGRVYIEPMLLLPFVENAFKHGDLNKSIKVVLELQDSNLHFSVSNYINLSKRKDIVGGIGIKNIERRLELLYPGKHSIAIREDEQLFSVELIIKLL